jgi:hypothetical protein
MDIRSLRDEYACARCCRAPEQKLSQTEVNHVSSIVTIQNLVSNAKNSGFDREHAGVRSR